MRQVRGPVRFADALGPQPASRRAARLLEIGPDPVLTVLAQSDADAARVAVLRGAEPRPRPCMARGGGLFVRGDKVDWPPCSPRAAPSGSTCRRTRSSASGSGRGPAAGHRCDRPGSGCGGASVAGRLVAVAGSDAVLLTSRLSVRSHPWLADHVVAGSVMVPGTAFVELAVRAGDRVGCDRVEELTLQAPLVLPEDGAVQVQIGIDAPEPGEEQRSLRVYSRPDGASADRPWTLHASGTLTAERAAADWDLSVWPPAGAEPVALDGLYERLTGAGLAYGPAFRGLREVWRERR